MICEDALVAQALIGTKADWTATCADESSAGDTAVAFTGCVFTNHSVTAGDGTATEAPMVPNEVNFIAEAMSVTPA